MAAAMREYAVSVEAAAIQVTRAPLTLAQSGELEEGFELLVDLLPSFAIGE